MKVVYIAGPFRATSSWGVQQNVMAAMATALDVWRRGAVAICPHANTMFFQGAAPDEVWLKGDLELLKRSDALLLLPTWRESNGAKQEWRAAIAWGKPIFHTLGALDRWLHAEEPAL